MRLETIVDQVKIIVNREYLYIFHSSIKPPKVVIWPKQNQHIYVVEEVPVARKKKPQNVV